MLRPLNSVRCERCWVRERSICAASVAAPQSDLAGISRSRVFLEDQTILSQGGEASIVGTLVRGTVRLTRTPPDGRHQVVGLLQPGEFFGRPFVEVTEFGYEAATDVEICVSERRAFERALEKNRALENGLLRTVLDDLAMARERVLLIGSLSAPERVTAYLLMMLGRRPNASSKIGSRGLFVSSFISRHDLASYLATTIESVSRQVHSLSRKGIIRILGANYFQILDYDALVAASGLTEGDLRLLSPVRATRAARTDNSVRGAA